MPAIVTALVLLTGCTSFKSDKAAFEAWREEFLAGENHEMTATVRCMDSDRVSGFELLYTKTPEGERVEVLDDELIAGVSASISEDETQLIFDGVVLETGSALTEKLSPVSALPELMKSLSEGFVQSIGREKKDGEELLVTQLLTPEDMTVTLWQKSNSMESVFATMQSGETVDITITITKIL